MTVYIIAEPGVNHKGDSEIVNHLPPINVPNSCGVFLLN